MSRYFLVLSVLLTVSVCLVVAASGCSTYKGVVKPTPKMSLLSQELEALSDDRISTLLASNPSVSLPTTVAVARLATPTYPRNATGFTLKTIRSEEAEGWRSMVRSAESGDGQADGPFTDLHLINPLLVGDKVNLETIRKAAAMLHAPLTLVYVIDDNTSSGTNTLSAVYFTIVGLFIIPGHTVGNYTSCQALLMDTRTGSIVATASGEAQSETIAPAISAGSVKRRVKKRTQRKAVADLQENFAAVMANLSGYQALHSATSSSEPMLAIESQER